MKKDFCLKGTHAFIKSTYLPWVNRLRSTEIRLLDNHPGDETALHTLGMIQN